ncbi:MAG: 2-C-methyl-D-erythritol 4-phosphate cytidylyltransferase [Candidatus Pacebacteria bacterium]|nr:2-C-methyl-D-erythritol 4-phosphate cytidylyltransferase [Candidatus Paceibacterota bacterium]MDD5357107.1 2-C-methyl-D-erythritol 4-phosphate cytidylyltransferase [Candidatus Paceibacterota bacterium]
MTAKSGSLPVYAILLAGGEGRRYSSGKNLKQFVKTKGKPLFLWALETYLKMPEVQKIAIVFPEKEHEHIKFLKKIPPERIDILFAKEDRHASIAYALGTFPKKGLVVIQDGISPLTKAPLIRETLLSAKKYGAATAFIPAIYRVFTRKENFIEKVLERQELGYTVSPQAFRIAVLQKALDAGKKAHVKDRAMVDLVRRIGKKVALVASNPENIKLTYPHDALTIEALLRKN